MTDMIRRALQTAAISVGALLFVPLAWVVLIPGLADVLPRVLPSQTGVQLVLGASLAFTALALLERSPHMRAGVRRRAAQVVGVALLLFGWLLVPVGGRGVQVDSEAGTSAPWLALGVLAGFFGTTLMYFVATRGSRRAEQDARVAALLADGRVEQDALRHGRVTFLGRFILPAGWSGPEGDQEYEAALKRYRARE